MRRLTKLVQNVTALAIVVHLLASQPSTATPPAVGRIARAFKEAKYHGTEPATGADTAIECLAENIDWLEHHVDAYGSIVAKQPDIWGEARLTKHRDEYEQMLFRELNQFQFRLNAAITQSDSSFLRQSLALSAAAAGTTPTAPTSTAPVQAADSLTADTTSIEGADKITIEPTILLDQLSRYLYHLHELRRINEGDDTSDSPGYSLNLVRMPISILPGKHTREGFGAEITMSADPVLTADLMPTTFRNLVVNDLVAQLGLPLVRATEQYSTLASQYRAKLPLYITIEEGFRLLNALEYELKEVNELLKSEAEVTIVPESFWKLVDAFRKYLGDLATVLDGEQRPEAQIVREVLKQLDLDLSKAADGITEEDTKRIEVSARKVYTYLANNAAPAREFLEDFYAKFTGSTAPAGRTRQAKHPVPPSQIAAVYGMDELLEIAKFLCSSYAGRHIRWQGKPRCKTDDPVKCDPCNDSRITLIDARGFLQSELDAAYELLAEPQHVRLWYRLAKPDSGLAEAIRSGHLRTWNHGVHSVQNLRELFFYSLHRHGTDDEISEQFVDKANLPLAPRDPPRIVRIAQNPVEALAWAVVVESALLNKRLNEDVRKVAVAKQCYDLQMDRELSFFLPESVMRPLEPAEELVIGDELERLTIPGESVRFLLKDEYQLATDVFQRYVRCRWPIHVFALDPVAQDQNVADASARKRELQFAMSLAFVTGQIGGNSLTQFSRDLQTEINTIALNRTAAGFAHGPDTFGWRFYPRVQGLDVPGTMGTLWQTIRGTPRDGDLRRRQIEPGMRECIAIVLMPSFVPYVDMHVRSNWFKLTNPKNAALTMKDTVRLSRAITAMRDSRLECIRCEHLYRPGEVHRLLQRVSQLDRELPLQTMRTQVPYENTLGGFEMFNMGVTDLSPELIGWHGAPGIVIDPQGTNQYTCGCTAGCNNGSRGSVTADDPQKKASPPPICDGKGTTLFLVGDNFSVHDTRVIAGGVCIPHVQLISRQIMRVTIPSCVNVVCVDDQEYVAIHVATPYGVTNHLHIPIYRRTGLTCDEGAPRPPVANAGSAPRGIQFPEQFVLRPTRLPRVHNVSGGQADLQFAGNHRPSPDRLRTTWHDPRMLFVRQVDGDDAISDPTPVQVGPVQVEGTLQVVVPAGDDGPHSHEHAKKHPILNRMKVHVRENWRNVRDQLPYN